MSGVVICECTIGGKKCTNHAQAGWGYCYACSQDRHDHHS